VSRSLPRAGDAHTDDDSATSMEVLTVVEVARLLRVSQRTVQRLVASERIPFVRVGRSVRFRQPSLAAWLASTEVRPTMGAGHPGEVAKTPRGRERPSRSRRPKGDRWYGQLKSKHLTEGGPPLYPDGTALLRPCERGHAFEDRKRDAVQAVPIPIEDSADDARRRRGAVNGQPQVLTATLFVGTQHPAQAGFRIQWPQGREGSTPSPGTSSAARGRAGGYDPASCPFSLQAVQEIRPWAR